MKITKAKLKQLIKEELRNISEGFLEDPFDKKSGLIATLLGIDSNLLRSGDFEDSILKNIEAEARSQKVDPREFASREIYIMRQQLEELMNNIEKRIMSYFPRGTQTQSQALTKDGKAITHSNP